MPITRRYQKTKILVRIVLFLAFVIFTIQFIDAQTPSIHENSSTSSPVDFQAIEHLGLVGCLMVAVTILWKTNQAERAISLLASKASTDAQIAATKASVEALTTSAASNAELRHIIEDSVETNREMGVSLKELVQVIAMMNQEIEKIRNRPCPAGIVESDSAIPYKLQNIKPTRT